jgi:hypothetical protein
MAAAIRVASTWATLVAVGPPAASVFRVGAGGQCMRLHTARVARRIVCAASPAYRPGVGWQLPAVSRAKRQFTSAAERAAAGDAMLTGGGGPVASFEQLGVPALWCTRLAHMGIVLPTATQVNVRALPLRIARHGRRGG